MQAVCNTDYRNLPLPVFLLLQKKDLFLSEEQHDTSHTETMARPITKPILQSCILPRR